MRITERQFLILFYVAITLIFLGLFVLLWNQISGIIRLVLIGAFFAYILTPVSEFLERYVSRSVAVIILIAAVLLLVTILILFFIPRFFGELKTAVEKLPEFIDSLKEIGAKMQDIFERLGLPPKMRRAILDYNKKLEDTVAKSIGNGADKLIKSLASLPDLILVPVLGFYFLKDREYFSKTLVNILPQSRRNNILRIFHEINKILHQFIRGQILISVIIAIMSAVGYWIVGLQYSLILGLFMGSMEIIPYFGPWLGAIPAVLIAIINGPAKLLWTVIVIVIIQQLENGIIAPKILANEVQLHPVYVILSIWAGGVFFGLLGMLLAVPFILVIRILFKHLVISIATIK